VVIIVQDRIDVPGEQLERLLSSLRDGYIPGAAQRGLRLVEQQVSPPLRLQRDASTVWLRWQVRDVEAWWAMRAASGDPAVAAFWAEVDSYCVSRERRYLTASDAVPPGPPDISAQRRAIRGYRETAQLALRTTISSREEREFCALLERAGVELSGLELACLQANLAPDYAAGDYTWDLLYPDRESAHRLRETPYWRNQVMPAIAACCRACHALALDTVSAGARRSDLSAGVKRTAYFRLLPGVAEHLAESFERDLLEMPAHIPQIINWRLSRARTLPWDSSGSPPWTWVWEQEFENLEGLTGPYMAHPHHWAHVDRWFDPESGAQIIDADLSHAFCALPRSVLGREIIADDN
jgi:hypothetical protein